MVSLTLPSTAPMSVPCYSLRHHGQCPPSTAPMSVPCYSLRHHCQCPPSTAPMSVLFYSPRHHSQCPPSTAPMSVLFYSPRHHCQCPPSTAPMSVLFYSPRHHCQCPPSTAPIFVLFAPSRFPLVSVAPSSSPLHSTDVSAVLPSLAPWSVPLSPPGHRCLCRSPIPSTMISVAHPTWHHTKCHSPLPGTDVSAVLHSQAPWTVLLTYKMENTDFKHPIPSRTLKKILQEITSRKNQK